MLCFARNRRQISDDEVCRMDRQRSFEVKVRAISDLANKAMKPAELRRGGLPVRDTVVVKYDDLLRIWDIADRLLNDTVVK